MGVSTSLDTNGERGAAKNERFVAVSYIVIPAKAGIQSARRLIPRWVPAFAGMTYLRSEEHTSELQSLMRISYAVFCLKKQKTTNTITLNNCTNSYYRINIQHTTQHLPKVK